MKPIIFMYSGQGAQYFGMGAELYAKDGVFRDWMDRCSKVVEPLIGASLSEMIYEAGHSKTKPFQLTRYTHPANISFCFSLTQLLYARGVRPNMVLGYSLGEYAAAMVAETIPFEEGLRRITRMGLALEAECPDGGMMAILANPNLMDKYPSLFKNSWLAAHNFSNHFVITATPQRLKEIQASLDDMGHSTQILPITHGFHSPLIDKIEAQTRKEFGDLGRPRIPFFSGQKAARLDSLTADHMWDVVRNPVSFAQTLKQLESQGPWHYLDVGPAGTLATFAKYVIGRNGPSSTYPAITPFGKDMATLQTMLDAVI